MRTVSLAKFSIRILLLLTFVSGVMISGTARARLTEDDIEALRRQGEEEGWTFTVGPNPATQYDLDQLCGTRVPEDWQMGVPIIAPAPAKSLPAEFDWRDSSGTTPIRNQGGCGSCWAFATVGALECNIKIKGGVDVDLSEQWLVSCNQDGWGCGGGWFAHDYHEWKADPCGGTGAVLEAYFPYEAANLPCDCPYPHSYLINDWAFIGGVDPPIASIKQAIMDFGPVSVCVYVNNAFQGYTGGVFNGCQEGGCNHAVCLVGWDDNQGDSGVWFMRNSWGPGWGESGYMRIPYGCSIIGDYACYVDYRGYPQAVLTYPAGGEIFYEDINITWTAIDPDPGQTELLDIDLEYSPDEGVTWAVIDTGLTNDGSHLWSVSGLDQGAKYLLRITATDPDLSFDVDTTDAPFTISGLLPDAVWTADGAGDYQYFGWALAGAGDLNGDGYEDVVAGTPLYPDFYTLNGGAFVYFGSALGLSLDADWSDEGESALDYFGTAVDRAGDVNGDGYGDLIIGAEGYSNGQVEEGAVYLYLGGPAGPSAEPDAVLEIDAADAHFGFSVAAAGDVNGDGYSDILVGSPYYDVSGYDEGRADLFLGGPAGLAGAPAWTVQGDENEANVGHSVAAAGDVDGDGYSDILVGAPKYSLSGGESIAQVGRISLYLGGPSGPSGTPDWTFTGGDDYEKVGWSLATAGDINGDGYSDIIAGAPGYTEFFVGEGRAYLFLGGSGGPADTATWTGQGGQQTAEYGHSVAAAGDVNGDGLGDFLVGVQNYDDGEADEGCAVLYLGREEHPYLVQAWRAYSDQVEAYLGYCVAGAGDVDGDGFGETLASAYLYDGVWTDGGRIFLYPGGAVPGMLPFCARQNRADGMAPVGPLGLSGSQSQVRLQATGWYSDGSENVKLQWEMKPLGTVFDGTGLGQSAAWALADSADGVELEETVGGLIGNTPYHWRARVLYEPGNPLGLDHSRWLSPPHNGPNETDFRSGEGGGSPPAAVTGLTATLVDGAKSSSGDILLAWTEPYAESGVSHYVIYRSTAPTTTGDSLGATADTTYVDGGAAGDTLANYYYTVRAVDSEGRNSAPSGQVGEFDRPLKAEQ
jgi:C1A family cysteine protease